jgi:hypothetical protein
VEKLKCDYSAAVPAVWKTIRVFVPPTWISWSCGLLATLLVSIEVAPYFCSAVSTFTGASAARPGRIVIRILRSIGLLNHSGAGLSLCLGNPLRNIFIPRKKHGTATNPKIQQLSLSDKARPKQANPPTRMISPNIHAAIL